jgi:hypothetical protein
MESTDWRDRCQYCLGSWDAEHTANGECPRPEQTLAQLVVHCQYSDPVTGVWVYAKSNQQDIRDYLALRYPDWERYELRRRGIRLLDGFREAA